MSLELEHLTAAYDGEVVFRDFSSVIPRGDVVGVVGPNGAGKSTLLKAILSLTPVKRGRVRLDGEDITSMMPQALVHRGITLVPEGRHVFGKMTVQENLELGGYSLPSSSDRRDQIKSVFQQLPKLAERRRQLAGTLSGGEQQLLVLARALMSRPRYLLVDEPYLGLSTDNRGVVSELLHHISTTGVGLIITEEDPEQLRGLAHRIIGFEVSREVENAGR